MKGKKYLDRSMMYAYAISLAWFDLVYAYFNKIWTNIKVADSISYKESK